MKAIPIGARKNGVGEEDTRVYLACLVVYAHITFIGLFLRLTRGPPYLCVVLNTEITLWSNLVPIAFPEKLLGRAQGWL